MSKQNNGRIFRILSNHVRRRIIESLEEKNLSFTELKKLVIEIDHGKLGFHLRSLKGYISLDTSTKKYFLTERGELIAALLSDYRYLTSLDERYVDSVGLLSVGNHAVAFYTNEDFKHRILFPYVEKGLSRGEAVLYLTSEDKLDYEAKAIKRHCEDFEKYREGTFTIESAHEWYIEQGKAQAEKIIANLSEFAEEKVKAGFKALRASGDTEAFFEHLGIGELLRYENLLGRRFAGAMCGLCLYYTKRLDEENISQLMKSHSHIFSKALIGALIHPV